MALKLIQPGERKGNKFILIRGSFCGVPIEVSTKTRDTKAAKRIKAEIELRILSDADQKKAPVTFALAAQRYMAHRKPSWRDERAINRLLPLMGEIPVAEVKQDNLSQAAEILYGKFSPATKNRKVIRPAAAILHYDARNEWCPWLRLQTFKEPRPQTRAVSGEVAQVLIKNAPQGPKRILLLWLFTTGMRIADTLRIEWAQIDLKHGTLTYHVSKTDQHKTKPLQPSLLKALRSDSRPREGYLFPWRYQSSVRHWLAPYCAKLGIHFTPHMARHSLGKWLNESGAGIRTIMDVLDHQSVGSSIRYQSTSMEVLKSAVGEATENLGRNLGKGL